MLRHEGRDVELLQLGMALDWKLVPSSTLASQSSILDWIVLSRDAQTQTGTTINLCCALFHHAGQVMVEDISSR